MKMINENNYQEWFVDFKDGNLSLQQEEAMFLFLEQNPQLQSEFDEWMEIDPIPVPQSKSDVQDFSHLIKNIITVDVINERNYSDFFIAYYEGDLSAEEIKLVDEFVRKNDFLNEEFLLFSQIKMKPDLQVKMDEKDLPYKKAVVFSFKKVFQYAAAASVIVAATLFFQPKSPTLSTWNIESVAEVNAIKVKNSIPIESQAVEDESSKTNWANVSEKKINSKPKNVREDKAEEVDNLLSVPMYTAIDIPIEQSIPNKPIGKMRAFGVNMYESVYVANLEPEYLTPWAWVRSKTIGKISPKNTDKLLIKDDIQPILAYSLKETLGVNFKNEKTEKGKNKFQFSIGNFSVER